MLLRKYGCWLVISILLLPVLIAVLIYAIDLIIRCFDSWSQIPELKFMKYEYKINVVDMVAAIATVFSAVGLLWFGQLTYKNQQNNEFYSLFNTLLNEHNRLLKDLLEKHKEKVEEINKEALSKILESYSDEKKLEDIVEKDIIPCMKKIIEHKVEIKPYLIILFRLLKLIDGTEKIDKEDKRGYYALVRGLIPMEILLLILFNSRVWPEKVNKSSDGKYKNYKELLEEAKLFEHLPIEDETLKKAAAGLSKQGNEKPEQSDNDGKAENKEIDSISKQFVRVVYCGGFIGENAFGQSVYIKKMKDKENIGNT